MKKRNVEVLKFLARAKPRTAKAFLKTADVETIRTLCECCFNLLKGNVPLTQAQKRKLTPYKNTLRAVIGKQLSLKKRKQYFQKGGFLGALLAPVLGTVLGAILPK